MNCEIQPMNKNRRSHVDTLPPRGRVNEVRREWLVHEDGALAYRLQNEEIKQHLISNKSRNVQIREDFPTAKSEQLREVEEAQRLHQQLLLQQEQQDAKVAAQLADHIEREEKERQRMLEEEDKELAKLLQEEEQSKILKRERTLRELETHTPRKDKYLVYDHKRNVTVQRPMFPVNNHLESCQISNQNLAYHNDNLSDINNVGLPLQEDVIDSLRNCHVSGRVNYRLGTDSLMLEPTEEEIKRIQEERDAAYARYLQEKEDLENIDTVNKDRLLAIETQDKELARLLQEKERAKARRARERAKQKAALKKMQEEKSNESTNDGEMVTIKVAENVPVNCQRKLNEELVGHKEFSTSQPDLISKNIKPKPRYPDPEEIVEVLSERSSTSANIAMSIDPTYTRENLEKNPRIKKSSSKPYKSHEESQTQLPSFTPEDLAVDGTAPPYMPIQGQRRLPEKKPKQKDGCKQQ